MTLNLTVPVGIVRFVFIYDLNIIFKAVIMIMSDKIDSDTNDEGEW